MKRIMCLLLALVMVFSLVGVSAFAADDETDAEETASEETADPAAESEEEDSSEEPATEEPVEDEADAEETEEVEESNAGIMLMSSGSSGTVTVPVTVTGDSDGIYSWSDYSEITVGRSYSIQIKAGYDIEVTGAAVTSRSNYRLDSDGNVYRSCSFTVSEEDYVEGLTVTVEIVTSSEETPTAVKITEILPEGATENDVYYGSSPDAYVLSNGYGSFRLRKGYTVTATGADLLYAGENTYSTTYYIYPQDGAEEITLTFTKLDGGTLAVTGESSQLVEITDGSDTIETGSFVENDGILYITVNEGYVVTGGTTYGRHSTTDGIQTIYTVAVADILTDGVATVNVEQGVIVKVVSEDETGAEYAAGIDGYTYAVGELIYTYGNFNYIAEFSGAGVSVTDTIYDCIETTGAVCPRYTLTTSSAGTLTISIRQAKDGELPTAIKVEYIDEDNALVKGTSYVLPGNSLSVLTKTDYTVEVKGATPYSISIGDIYYNGSEYVSEWYGSVDEDATAVTVTVVPVVDSAKLKIVDESGADASAAAIQVEDIDSVVAGDTLDAGRNYLCLANGYEIANVEGATYYELGYDIADDGTIYVRYALVPTGDPSTVQVTVVEKAILATVTIVNNGIHAYVDNYKEKISNTEYTVLSADEFYVDLGGYTVRVTGGVVNTEKSYVGSTYDCRYYIQPTSENVTVEIISFEELAEILGDSADGAIAVDATNDPAQQPSEGNNNPGGTTPGGTTPGGTTPGGDQPSDKPDSKPDAQPGGDKPDGEAGGAPGEAPKTGDEANATLWAVLVGAFAVSAGAVLTVLKKKNN